MAKTRQANHKEDSDPQKEEKLATLALPVIWPAKLPLRRSKVLVVRRKKAPQFFFQSLLQSVRDKVAIQWDLSKSRNWKIVCGTLWSVKAKMNGAHQVIMNLSRLTANSVNVIISMMGLTCSFASSAMPLNCCNLLAEES